MMKTEELTKLLKNTNNLILHGAPGTGKTFMAFEIAKQMGCTENEICFVQFHPSYDYTDFVEGIRPANNGNNEQIGFERIDGLFKQFCKTALKKSINSSEEDFKKIIYKKIKESNEFVMKSYPYDYIYTLDLEHNDILLFSILRGLYAPRYNKITIRLSVLVNFMFFDELSSFLDTHIKRLQRTANQKRRFACDAQSAQSRRQNSGTGYLRKPALRRSRQFFRNGYPFFLLYELVHAACESDTRAASLYVSDDLPGKRLPLFENRQGRSLLALSGRENRRMSRRADRMRLSYKS